MNVDWAYDEKTQGSEWDPLLKQIYIPTWEYIPTIHSAHYDPDVVRAPQ